MVFRNRVSSNIPECSSATVFKSVAFVFANTDKCVQFNVLMLLLRAVYFCVLMIQDIFACRPLTNTLSIAFIFDLLEMLSVIISSKIKRVLGGLILMESFSIPSYNFDTDSSS